MSNDNSQAPQDQNAATTNDTLREQNHALAANNRALTQQTDKLMKVIQDQFKIIEDLQREKQRVEKALELKEEIVKLEGEHNEELLKHYQDQIAQQNEIIKMQDEHMKGIAKYSVLEQGAFAQRIKELESKLAIAGSAKEKEEIADRLILKLEEEVTNVHTQYERTQVTVQKLAAALLNLAVARGAGESNTGTSFAPFSRDEWRKACQFGAEGAVDVFENLPQDAVDATLDDVPRAAAEALAKDNNKIDPAQVANLL